jgi:hypothetical protein
MIRQFKDECEETFRELQAAEPPRSSRPVRLLIPTGVSVAPHIERLCSRYAPPWVHAEVVPVANRFFGETITVTGLIVGQDLLRTVEGKEFDAVLISASMLRENTECFLDDMTLEEVRRKILKTFSHSRILLLPQTVSYADDENGRKSLAEDRKVFDRCRRLVVFAGNPKSEEFLRANFRAKVIPMKDMVLSLGNVEDVVKRRKGILLALRSDLESALTGEMKEEILQVSGRFTRDVFVTDTCVHREMRDDAEAEELLRRKWSLFSGKELIITDRLQGMMFAVITGTPCIVVGSENSVLAKTYPTVSGCGYLDYVTDTGKLEDAIGRMMHAAGKKKYVPDYSRDFRKLDRMLAGAAGV